jgi:hypothetical protein
MPTPTGLRLLSFGVVLLITTPRLFAVKNCRNPGWGWNIQRLDPQGSREARQPWAGGHNRLAVVTS